jgi:hypothetical protein
VIRSETGRRRALRAWYISERVGLHEAVFVISAFLVYFLIRGAVAGRAGEAVARGIDVIALERQFGLYHELTMQSWILDDRWLIKAMNWIYFWGHMPVVILFAVWLFLTDRRMYTLARNAFLASGAIGVVIYWLLPVAPPRLLPGYGFVDTMAIYDRISYNAQEVGTFVNQYAAVPSLHFGWALLLGLMVAWATRHPVTWVFGVAWPVAMFFAVVMTGNHFMVDAIAGGAVSFAGLAIALGMERARPYVLSRVRERLSLLGPPGERVPEPWQRSAE